MKKMLKILGIIMLVLIALIIILLVIASFKPMAPLNYTKESKQAVIPIDKMNQIYEKIAAAIKVMARRISAEHG